MRVTRLSGSEGGGILCDSPYPYSDFVSGASRDRGNCAPPGAEVSGFKSRPRSEAHTLARSCDRKVPIGSTNHSQGASPLEIPMARPSNNVTSAGKNLRDEFSEWPG
jgi:hypothetical protein